MLDYIQVNIPQLEAQYYKSKARVMQSLAGNVLREININKASYPHALINQPKKGDF